MKIRVYGCCNMSLIFFKFSVAITIVNCGHYGTVNYSQVYVLPTLRITGSTSILRVEMELTLTSYLADENPDPTSYVCVMELQRESFTAKKKHIQSRIVGKLGTHFQTNLCGVRWLASDPQGPRVAQRVTDI